MPRNLQLKNTLQGEQPSFEHQDCLGLKTKNTGYVLKIQKVKDCIESFVA